LRIELVSFEAIQLQHEAYNTDSLRQFSKLNRAMQTMAVSLLCFDTSAKALFVLTG